MSDEARKKAHALMDEILVYTVLDKEWGYKRVAEYSIDKMIDVLMPFINIGLPAIDEKIKELQQMHDEIQKLKV